MLQNRVRAINNYKIAVILTLPRSEAKSIVGKLKFSRTNKTISHRKRNEVVKSCLRKKNAGRDNFLQFKDKMSEILPPRIF